VYGADLSNGTSVRRPTSNDPTRLTGIADPVNVVGWGDAPDRAGGPLSFADLDKVVTVDVVQGLGLGALQHHEGAPRR
jgi:hypothetical protein